MNNKNRFHIDYSDHGIVYALIIFLLILAMTNENFRAMPFYQNILRQSSFNAICGIGMTFAIISGNFDLSVAAQVALVSVTLTKLMPVVGVLPAILIVLVFGVALGAFNGILIAKIRIPAFIATLATQLGYRALAQLIENTPIVVKDAGFKHFSLAKVGIVPVPFIIMTGIAIIGTIILRKTRLGRSVIAIGNSHEAAKISGINISWTLIRIYMIVGLFTACSAIMLTSYLGSSNFGMQIGLEFTVISAVVLGGTALAGGKGSIFNTIVAAIFLVTLKSAMDTWGLDSSWQRVLSGVILVVAFSITTIRTTFNIGIIKYRSRKNLRRRLRNQPGS